MAQTKDIELLPEAEMHIRAAGSTPYEIARDPRKYPQSRILAAAELVGTGPKVLAALVDLLNDSDSAVRYWGAVGLDALGPEAAPAKKALKTALDDTSPNVRLTAAGILCRLGAEEEALPVLAQGLMNSREVVVLYAARTLEMLGDKAGPLHATDGVCPPAVQERGRQLSQRPLRQVHRLGPEARDGELQAVIAPRAT